ncbi:branched-chain amino acid ABC transporter permease [Cupriavidus sp. AcVe19-1a]|uniref:branched-chain amino acid ABC transporter permease n=1 Tax=Cupriavidus sp. AcVe19-1a TaxID=2821359 RepID=UPI001AE2C25F|nr:branched-chain amino acid ABC transporter permease [Cupriavidus sp. AcVe19-1a]MBP0633152.1 branched-chain amino acid ABC transporter permease [Cupriavidus sp. AcVe19-1a]
MHELLHQISTGMVNGCIYAMLALALVVVYRSTHHVNFAQGEMAMFSTYIAAILIGANVPYAVAFLACVLFAFVSGALVERVVMRPLHHAPVLSVVTVFVALYVIVQSAAGLVFGYETRSFPSPFDALGTGGVLAGHEVGILLTTVGVLAAMTAFFRFTRLGLAMRAVAVQPLSSQLVGIRVSRLLMLSWGIAGAVGAIAGMLAAPIVFLDPHMMSGIMIYAFAAAIVGGIDSPVGAVVGGILLGVFENLAGAYLVGTELKLTLALVAMIAVLIVKPQGLFGSRSAQRL